MARGSASLLRQGEYNQTCMNRERASVELTILEEKLQALKTLIRYESDLEKLKIYKRELDLVSAELESERKFLSRMPPTNVIPFPSNKRSRSA